MVDLAFRLTINQIVVSLMKWQLVDAFLLPATISIFFWL